MSDTALVPTNGQTALATSSQTPLAPYQPPVGIVEIAKALSKAQGAVKPAPHDRRNDYHKYDYTSSEGVITCAKKALSDYDLSLIPVEQTVNGFAEKGANRYELCRKFLLAHASGAVSPIVVNWPICVEAGRPLDKAVAIAATTSLAYLLRDLLLMPRVDPTDELAGRNDTTEPAKAPPKQKAPDKPAAKAPPVMPTEEEKARLKELIKATGYNGDRFRRDFPKVAETASLNQKGVQKLIAILEEEQAAITNPEVVPGEIPDADTCREQIGAYMQAHGLQWPAVAALGKIDGNRLKLDQLSNRELQTLYAAVSAGAQLLATA